MSVRKTYLAWLLASTATLGCNAILGNDPVVLDEGEENPGDGSTGTLDGRIPDTSGGNPGDGAGAGDNRTPTDGGLSDREGGSNPPPSDAPPPEGGAGSPDRDGGTNPLPDGSTTPPPDSTTPPPDSTTPRPDTTTPPTGTDGSVDTSTPPPPPDGGPTCTAPQILCAGQCVSPTDPKTCGSCTHNCTTLPHVSGATTCQAGTCVVPPGSCASGWAHCSTNADDGVRGGHQQARKLRFMHERLPGGHAALREFGGCRGQRFPVQIAMRGAVPRFVRHELRRLEDR